MASEMTPATNNTVYRTWEALYDQQFDLMKEAINKGDYSLIAAMEVQARMDPIDHVATFEAEARALGPKILEESQQVVEQLKDKLDVASEATKVDCDKIKSNMEALATSKDDDPEDWAAQFDQDMNALKEKTNKELDEVRDLGKQKIAQLPKDIRLSTSKAYTDGARAVSGFISKAVSFISDAINLVTNWIRDAWTGIRTWARNTVDWYRGAASAIVDAFAKVLKPKYAAFKAISGNPAGCGNFAAFEDLAKQLQNLGLDNFTLARKGNSWVIEPM